MRCNYPDCDGGSATGYCHIDCRPPSDTVTIPRAEYEALRKAEEFVRQYMAAADKTGERGSLYGKGKRILAALRAAGIEGE